MRPVGEYYERSLEAAVCLKYPGLSKMMGVTGYGASGGGSGLGGFVKECHVLVSEVM